VSVTAYTRTQSFTHTHARTLGTLVEPDVKKTATTSVGDVEVGDDTFVAVDADTAKVMMCASCCIDGIVGVNAGDTAGCDNSNVRASLLLLYCTNSGASTAR
jgi:hypothetical protein